MRYKTPTTLLRLTACLASVALLASCETYLESDSAETAQTTAQTKWQPDPAYEAVKNSIPDTDYPATQIVGEWVQLAVTHDRALRVKNYYGLKLDGTGQVRRLDAYNGKKAIEATADLRWTYLGLNRWSITVVPGSRRILHVAPDFEGQAQRVLPYGSFPVRFLPPRIYSVNARNSWVPLGQQVGSGLDF